MYVDNLITIAAAGDKKLSIIPKMANRHGLIAGATGTGKTITLKVMAESFADAGVPVFLADVKGDLAGMCKPGVDSDDMKKRIEKFKLADMGFSYTGYTTAFWDIYGKKGMPLRTTVSEFGPLLFSKLLDLNQTQSDILNVVFKIADDNKLLLLDMKDLKAMLNHVADHAAEYKDNYGNMAKQSINTIIRSLVALEDKGADQFFGEPGLEISDWIRNDSNGKGVINILDSSSLINEPDLYVTFMLWMLSDLFETMPEVGDLDKPKMVFFFDEAHLLFDNAPKVLLQKIEQVMKLIRSKGVGVFFITQNPSDISGEVLAQLGNKVQHALHAYTPAEQKGIKAAAEGFRTNPDIDTAKALQELGTGEALVSFLQEDGSPAIVESAKIYPPRSLMGPIDDVTRQQVIDGCPLKSKYMNMVDRVSAYETLQSEAKTEEETAAPATAEDKKKATAEDKEAKKEKAKMKRRVATVAGSAAGTVGRELGKELGDTLGGSFGKKIGGNVGASLGRGILQTLFKQ